MLLEMCDAFISASLIPPMSFNNKLELFSDESRIFEDDIKRTSSQEHDTSNSKPIPKSLSNLSSKYYLLTPHVWKLVICNTALLIVVEKIMKYYHIIPFSSTLIRPRLGPIVCHFRSSDLGILGNLVLPLLASSCCAIQLLINLITGIGCAGFNSILGPLRPFFVTILLYYTVTSFSLKEVKFIVLWLVTLMPEIVHMINITKGRKQMSKPSIQNENTFITDLNIQVLDMGCVACINKIESTLARDFPDSIVHVNSRLNDVEKGGEVSIKVLSSDKEFQSITDGIMSSIEKAGFKCKLHVQ